MAVLTTRPNATISNSFDLFGAGASAHARVNDDSDATGISIAQGGGGVSHSCRFGFAEPAIPGGAVVKQDQIRLRVSKEGAGSPPMRLTSVRAYPDSSTKAGERVNFDVNWISATTVVALVASNDLAHSALELAIDAHTFDGSLDIGVIREVYWDTIYVPKPVVGSVSVSPTSPISNSDQPTISWQWATDPDPDGGAQTKYQVRTFTAAQYGIGGFDPATSPASDDSGVVSSEARSYQIGTPLADATYRSYVRVGQTVNGVTHWSDYSFGANTWTLAVLRPAPPTFGAVAGSNPNGRIDVTANGGGGGATSTSAIQIQRSDDGGTTYANMRTIDGSGRVAPGTTARDYEAGNGVAVKYRIRAIHTFGTGFESTSAWVVQGGTVSWSSTDRWLKHPTNPGLNLKVDIYSVPSQNRPARQGEFQGLGSSSSLIVSDKRGPSRGTMTLDLTSDADRVVLLVALNSLAPMLVQVLPTDHWGDRWVKFSDQDTGRIVDKWAAGDTLENLGWTQVDSPPGDLISWI